MSRRILLRKVSELQERAESNPDGRLSRANDMILRMFQYQIEFDGKDQVLVVQTAGVVTGVSNRAHIVEVTGQKAASMLSNPNGQGAMARMATDEEVKAYRAYNDALTKRAKQKISDDQMAVFQNQMQSLLGVAGPASASADDAPKPPSPTPMEEKPTEPGPASTPALEGVDDPPTASTPLSAGVLELLKGDQEANLRAAGYLTMESIQDAEVETLAADVNGVGKATAAKLVTEAAVGLSDDEPE
jgi:hypothetical protein